MEHFHTTLTIKSPLSMQHVIAAVRTSTLNTYLPKYHYIQRHCLFKQRYNDRATKTTTPNKQ